MPGYKEPEKEEIEKECLKSRTDPDCGYIHLEHLKRQPCYYNEITLDGGYDIGAVYRGVEILGVNGYTAIRECKNDY